MSSTSLDSSPEVSPVSPPLPLTATEAPARPRRVYNLPATPVVTIKATKSWLPLNFRQLWTSRELLYF